MTKIRNLGNEQKQEVVIIVTQFKKMDLKIKPLRVSQYETNIQLLKIEEITNSNK